MANARLELYRTHYRRLGRACLDLSQAGFLVDETRRRELADEAMGEIDRLRRELRGITPFDLFGQGKRKGEVGKGLSSPKVNAYFYDHLKCKEYRKKAHLGGGRTADEKSVRRLMRKYKKARPAGERILALRMWFKRQEFLEPRRVDDDGRFRALYVPNAVSGRLTSSANPLGSGSNGQNIPRPPSPVRSIFVPDKGHVLIELDFSRIEDRLLGGMSGDKRMAAEAQPESRVDTYQDVADDLQLADHFAEFFGPTTHDDDAEPLRRPALRRYYVRQAGKRTKLAAGYGMRGETMSDALLLETEGVLDLDPGVCDDWLAMLFRLRKGIPAYQAWTQDALLANGYLENSWGRRFYVRKLRLADDDYRDGYAWRCQSEAGVNTNQLGFLPACKYIKANAMPARVVQQGHDALVVSVATGVARELMTVIGESMGQRREYPGAKGPWRLAIPVGYKVGATWGTAASEWKHMPGADAWGAALERAVGETWWRRGR